MNELNFLVKILELLSSWNCGVKPVV